MAYHVEPDGDIYVDTAFLNKVRNIPGVEIQHMGWGEFYFDTPQGRVEVDRMRGKDFDGQSGRAHNLYDDRGGTKAAEWLIEQVEKRGLDTKVAADDNIRTLLAGVDAGLSRWAKVLCGTVHSYVVSLASDGAPEVDGFVDDVLFAMILAKVQGLPTSKVRSAGVRAVVVDGRRLTWKVALEEAVERFPDEFSPLAGRWTYRVRVNVGSIYETVPATLNAVDKSATTDRVALSQVAKIILDQMGGARRVAVMLGVGSGPSYYFYDLPGNKGVGFSWPNRQRTKGNTVEITLEPDDTYTMRFFNVSGADKKKVKELKDIYAEQLVDIFEGQTGWYIRLG